MIAGGEGHDAAAARGRIERGELVVGAAKLERAGPLQRLGLEEHAAAGERVEHRRGDERRLQRDPGEPTGRNVDVGRGRQCGRRIDGTGHARRYCREHARRNTPGGFFRGWVPAMPHELGRLRRPNKQGGRAAGTKVASRRAQATSSAGSRTGGGAVSSTSSSSTASPVATLCVQLMISNRPSACSAIAVQLSTQSPQLM